MQDLRKKSKERGRSKFLNPRNGRKLSWNKVLIAQSISAIILIACSSVVSEEGTIEVYFCPPCEDVFVNFVTPDAKCAFYDLDSERLLSSLNEDNVLVFEENYANFGAKVYSNGLMHNKFCVYDDNVITGSTNPTDRGFNVNYNNLIIIKSETIANNYLEEYFEVKERRQEKTKVTKVNLSGILIENYFCPEDDCEERVLEILENAGSVRFILFSFTSDTIGNVLLKKDSEGLMESFGLNKYSEYEKLKDKVKLERTSAMLHHKVFIIDEKIVITGSYNPTKAGNEKNDENILIIHDEEIARKFLENYLLLETIV